MTEQVVYVGGRQYRVDSERRWALTADPQPVVEPGGKVIAAG